MFALKFSKIGVIEVVSAYWIKRLADLQYLVCSNKTFDFQWTNWLALLQIHI